MSEQDWSFFFEPQQTALSRKWQKSWPEKACWKQQVMWVPCHLFQNINSLFISVVLLWCCLAPFPSFLFGKLTVGAIKASVYYCVTVQYDASSSSLLDLITGDAGCSQGWLWSFLCLSLLERPSLYQAWVVLGFFFSHSHPLKDYRANLYEAEAGNSRKTAGRESSRLGSQFSISASCSGTVACLLVNPVLHSAQGWGWGKGFPYCCCRETCDISCSPLWERHRLQPRVHTTLLFRSHSQNGVNNMTLHWVFAVFTFLASFHSYSCSEQWAQWG